MSIPAHHVKQEYCETRPKYRRGKKKTAVKVYTINLESKYLIISGVPATGLQKDLVKLCRSQGIIQQYKKLEDYPREEFTEVYLVQYREIQTATKARIKLDERYFFGSMLHVFYAPEFETLADTRQKILHRRRSVTTRVKQLKNEEKQNMKKRKLKETKQDTNNQKAKAGSPSEPPTKMQKLTNARRHSVLAYQQTLAYKTPNNSAGVPMFLPPPPLPSMAPLPRAFQFLSKPVSVHATFRATNLSTSNKLQAASNVETQNLNRYKQVKTEPKLRPASGYFYQKALHQLSSPTENQSSHSTIASKNLSKLSRKPPNPAPVVRPAFLPRHIELKQLDEINKVETGPDGKIPLLGSYIHSSKHSSWFFSKVCLSTLTITLSYELLLARLIHENMFSQSNFCHQKKSVLSGFLNNERYWRSVSWNHLNKVTVFLEICGYSEAERIVMCNFVCCWWLINSHS